MRPKGGQKTEVKEVQQKRRIVPVQVLDEKTVGNIPAASSMYPTAALEKHYQNILAIEKKYVKPSKSAIDHGTHYQYLHDFQQYVMKYLELKRGRANIPEITILRNNFDKHMFYSTKTKRFRKYK
jgi:hypothetical protein